MPADRNKKTGTRSRDADSDDHSSSPPPNRPTQKTSDPKTTQRRRDGGGHADDDAPARHTLEPSHEVLEISTDDDPIGSGPPWDIRPDDTMYRGRAGRSTVGSVQSARDASPVQTRGNRRSGTSRTRDAHNLGSAPAAAWPETPTRPKPTPRPRFKPKTPKSADFVASSDEEDQHPAPPNHPSSHSPTKRGRVDGEVGHADTPSERRSKKTRLTPFPLELESDEDLPSLLEILKSMRAAKKKRQAVVNHTSTNDHIQPRPSPPQLKRRPSTRVYADTEAVEEDLDGSSVHSDGGDDVHMDQYDLDDPFIDDSEDVKISRGKTEPKAKSKGGKGKERARSATPAAEDSVKDEVLTDEEGLSAHELADLKEARRLSLLKPTPRVGESSATANASPAASSSSPGKAAATASKAPRTPSPKGPSTPPQTPRRRINIAELVNRHAKKAGRTPPPPSSPSQVTIEELTLERRCVSLTEHDEVLDRAIMDEILVESYSSNPKLRRGRLIPWTTATGIGLVRFAAWAEQCPDMDGEIAYDGVTFKQSRNIRNPSRTSPLDIALNPTNGTTRYNVYIYGPPATPMVGFSTGFVEFSQLISPSSTGLRQRFIRLIFHSQDWESLEGFVREITGLTEVHAQFARDALQFSTRAQATPSYTSGSPSGSRSLRTSPQKMFQARASSTANRTLADNFSLPNDVVVPVYDARRAESFDFATDLHRLDRLPMFRGEVPYGSFAGVGYTMTLYKSTQGNWTMGFNIQWVIVFGTPPED